MIKITKLSSKNIAFTLAETLIVVGMIGVIAALTLPNLNQSPGDKETVAKVKKVYTELNDAIGRAQEVYGLFGRWCNNYSGDCQKRYCDRITEFMKISKSCGQADGCASTAQTNLLNGEKANALGLQSESDYQYLLADGTTISIDGYIGISSEPYIDIDIDGPKGANTWGKDIFTFYVDKRGNVEPSRCLTDDNLKNVCFKKGYNCTEWVIQNENLDYLKADRTGKCPNNTQLSLTVTRCK